jgi:hypothetical protein
MLLKRVLSFSYWIFSVLIVGACVTVANAETVPTQPTQPQGAGTGTSHTVDDADLGWIWNGMDSFNDPQLHDESAHAGGPGGYGAFTFHGVAVEVYGMRGPALVIDGRSHKLGRLKVSIDGQAVATIAEKSTEVEYNAFITKVDGLTNSNHVLQVAPDAGWAVVDYIVVHSTSAETKDGTPSSASAIHARYYRIVPRIATDMCLDVANMSYADGTIFEIFQRTAMSPTIWEIIPLGNERYRLSPAYAPTQAMTLGPISDAVRTPVPVLQPYTGAPEQQFFILPFDGYYRIAPTFNADETLNVSDNVTANGTHVIGYDWVQAADEEWWLDPVKAQ